MILGLMEIGNEVSDTDVRPMEAKAEPPKPKLQAHDDGHTPEYSVFALVGLSPNRFYGNEAALNELREELSRGIVDVDVIGQERIDRELLGLSYDENDRVNGTILWARTYTEHNAKGRHSYLFEDCAVFTVDARDRVFGNTYNNAAMTKVGDSFYTFLTGQDFEKIDCSAGGTTDCAEEGFKDAEAIVRTARGHWGNQRTGKRVMMPQAYMGVEPRIETVKIPFRNRQEPPLTGGFAMLEEKDDDTVRKLNMYDRQMLRMSRGLTFNLADMLAEKDPTLLQPGRSLRYLIHQHLFPGASMDDFVAIDDSKIPENLTHYEKFQVD